MSEQTLAVLAGCSKAHLAEMHIVGVVERPGQRIQFDGHSFCRITLRVDDAQYTLICRDALADEAATFAKEDVIEVDGKVSAKTWKSAHRYDCMVCEIEVSRQEVLWRRRRIAI